MANTIKEINSQDFKQTISKGVTLVDFWVPWCAPCKMQGKVLEQMASKIEAKAAVVKLNIDDATDVAGEAGVNAIPTLILYKDGKEISRMIGLQSEDKLVAEITAATK